MQKKQSFLWGGALVLALSSAALAHVGITIYIPQVPDPAAMKMDGKDDDWGWIDPSFITTPAECFTAGGETVAKSDYDFAYKSAWSPRPDNRFYFFYRAKDDTLIRHEDEPKRAWNDDCIQITFDPDHSGGDFLGENLEQVNNATRFHMRVLPKPNEEVVFNSMTEYIDMPSLRWTEDMFEGKRTGPESMEVGWTLLPAGAADLSTNVTYTFEIAFALYDLYGPTKAESRRHIFTADQVIHVGVRPLDADGCNADGNCGAKHQFYPLGSSTGQDQKGDQMPDYYTLPGEEGGTAVESVSWGRIKSHLDQEIR
jgi:hypothetical protein